MACFERKSSVGGNVRVEFLSSHSVDLRDVKVLMQRDCRIETLIRVFSEDGLFGSLAETDEDKRRSMLAAREDPSTSAEIDLAHLYCGRTPSQHANDPVREYDTISAHLIAQSQKNQEEGDLASRFLDRVDDSLDAAREQQNMAKHFAERPEFPSGFAVVLDSNDLLVASVAAWVVVSHGFRTVNMIGITTTLAVQLAGACAATPRGVARQLLGAVEAWGRANGAVLHCVEAPLFAMRQILAGHGFVRMKTGFMANRIGGAEDTLTEATMAKTCNSGFPRGDQFYEPLGKVLESSVIAPGIYLMEDIDRSKPAKTVQVDVSSETEAREKYPDYVTLYRDVTPGNKQQLHVHTQLRKRRLA